MQKSAFSILEETNFNYIIPKIQEKITGKADIYHFLSLNSIFDYLPSFVPTPLGSFLWGTIISHYHYDIFTRQQSDSVLRHLSMLDESEFKKFIAQMQARIQLQSSLYAMQCHQWNDAYALFAQKNNPFIPVFIPNKVIDCKGIKAIYEKPYVKNHLLTQVNEHLKLSPKERAEIMDSFSVVRKITEQDCIQDNVSPCLIGQQGVFARVDLSKYFFLGFYSGFYFDNPSESDDYFNSVNDGIDIYLFGHEGQERPVISAYRGGNRISLINSATDYTGTTQAIAHQLFYVQNTLPIDFKTDNNPDAHIRNTDTMFDISGYVTIRDVKAGEQLYVDYGYDYWKSKHVILSTSQEIDDAYMVLKKKNNP